MRKEGIGYLPDMRSPRETIEMLLDFFREPRSMERFSDFIENHYGRKSESTVRLIQNTLTNYGLIEEVEDFVFCITKLGMEWLLDPTFPELIRIISRRVVFVEEMLRELEMQSLSADELIRNAKSHYDWDMHGSDISRRTQILKSAGMLRMNRHKVYQITPAGKQFLQEQNLQKQGKNKPFRQQDIKKRMMGMPEEPSAEKAAETRIAKVSSAEKSRQALDAFLRKDNQNAPKIESVTRYILSRCEDITPLALQKALYYIQGFYAAFNGTFLFIEEDCEAWVHGPVYREIYEKCEGYHFDPMSAPVKFDDTVFSESEKAVINSVIQNLCCYSGKTLEKFTQHERPWILSKDNAAKDSNSRKIISKELMKDYFGAVRKKYQMISETEIKNYAKDLFEQV